MGIITRIKELFMKTFKSEAQTVFNTDIISSPEMEFAQQQWLNIIQGRPAWLSPTVQTINFGRYICGYMAKKTCLDLYVNIEGPEKSTNTKTKAATDNRAAYINTVVNQMVQKTLRDKVEDACGLGGIIIKPNGTFNPNNALDYILPNNFAVTEKSSNGDILGAVFIDRITVGNTYYTRLEYHHFDYSNANESGAKYIVENKAYKSGSEGALGNKIAMTDVKEWSGIEEYTEFEGVEKPLFAYLRMPHNNTIDFSSPEGVAIFADCIKELKDLDVAWSRKSDEIEDSQHITFINEQALRHPADKAHPRGYKIELPRFVKGLAQGIEAGNSVQEHIPTLLTEQRITEINSTLSMISTKCGCSQGQFVLDRKSGYVTATQIESDDQETVQTITDIRRALMTAIKDLVYAINKYCDVYFDFEDSYLNILDDDIPDEDIFYFKDLLSTFEADRTRAYQLMLQGIYSKKKYLMEYEGFSEGEAIAMMQEAAEEKQEAVKQQQIAFANGANTNQSLFTDDDEENDAREDDEE